VRGTIQLTGAMEVVLVAAASCLRHPALSSQMLQLTTVDYAGNPLLQYAPSTGGRVGTPTGSGTLSSPGGSSLNSGNDDCWNIGAGARVGALIDSGALEYLAIY